ncbi:MAG: hypothetical protein QMC77_08900, partial [Methanocellales archaeon]|nr:hypothetical protein [Methanocellales archaeon]
TALWTSMLIMIIRALTIYATQSRVQNEVQSELRRFVILIGLQTFGLIILSITLISNEVALNKTES